MMLMTKCPVDLCISPPVRTLSLRQFVTKGSKSYFKAEVSDNFSSFLFGTTGM